MEFTYEAYKGLLDLLREQQYAFCGYHNYEQFSRCVILRHDIDYSLEPSVKLAELEAEAGIQTTYFVLLRTDFYNIASKAGQSALRRIQSLGHEIGLHYDEAARAAGGTVLQDIVKECGLLSALLDTRVSSVSMHRPSKETLEADYQLPGLVNSYGQTFFCGFKYLSDSRRRWREPVEEIIRSRSYSRLHILTHAFWYQEQEESLSETVGRFLRSANRERYAQLEDNISDLASIIKEDQL